MEKDKYLEFLKQYYSLHQTINDIRRDAVVIYEGSPLKIGEFLASIRKQHKLHIDQKNSRGCNTEMSLYRYRVLDSLNIEWEPGKKKQKELKENDVCLNYVLEYYEKHHTLKGLPETATISGTEYNIKSFLSHRRINHRNYLAGINKKGSMKETELRRYEALDKIGFTWSPDEEKLSDDKPMRYLEKYYQEHKSLENLPNTVIFEGVTINIQSFLEDRRKRHRKMLKNPDYIPSELEQKRHKKLEEMEYDWDYFQKKQEERFVNDIYLEYLEYHYLKYGTINNIKAKDEVDYKDIHLNIGAFINEYRAKHYAYINGLKTKHGESSPLSLKRYEYLDALELDWRPSQTNIAIAKLAREHKLSKATLRKYIHRFHGDKEKAVKICKLIQQERINRRNFSKPSSTISTSNEPRLTTHNIPQINDTLMYSSDKTLRDYCIENRLNYNVIYKYIKARNNGLTSTELEELIKIAINTYKKNGQYKPISWIYSEYNGQVLLHHLMTSMSLDTDSILYDMSGDSVTLETAIENNCLKRHIEQTDTYLTGIYRKLVTAYNNAKNIPNATEELIDETLDEYIKKQQEYYHLTSEETTSLTKAINHYRTAMHLYHLYDVGFEQDEEIREAKIASYNFDDDDVEESFYMPLKFSEMVLMGQQENDYKRRMIIRGITMAWNYLSEEEQEERIKKFNITPKEKEYIIKSRHEIDKARAKVKKKCS